MRKRYSFLVLMILVFVLTSCKVPFFGSQVSVTPTPAATATSLFTPTPSATPLPTATSTPPPLVRVENADKSLDLGDYEQARRDYQDAFNMTSDEQVKAAAMLGMGRALYLLQNYSTAVDTLNRMVQTYPQSEFTAKAYFFLAKCYEEQKKFDLAAEAYTQFLKLRPGVIDAYIEDLRGDAFMSADNPQAAIEAYQASVAAPQLGDPIWTELELGKAYAATGDYANAIQQYLDVYNKSGNDYARAQANLLMGQAYMTLGEPEQAHTRFLDSVNNYPKAYDSYSGLVQLINDGVEVNELNRGLVDYYAQQYGLAIDAFTRYIETTASLDATPYHYRALSYLASQNVDAALNDWNTIIQNYQTDNLWTTAWEEKAYVQWAYLDKYEDAANTLLEYVNQAPQSESAPAELYDAARIFERNNQLDKAAATWEQVMNSYPSAEQSYRALFLSGVTSYRLKDYTKSLTIFQRALVLGNTPTEQAAAYLWIGKSQQGQGDLEAAKKSWSQAVQRDPTDYYSIRANELIQNQAPFTVDGPIDLGYDLAQERPQAEAWLRTTFALPAETDLSGLGDLASDPRVIRGMGFWDLGLYSEARDEYESLREEVKADPAKTYRLMNHMLDLGLYRSAILASRQILDLAHLDDLGTLQAPAYFNHIRFGVYFKDQILEASQAEGFSPIFLLSVLRQESMFESFAQSGAGARGLMQIMPTTGHEIASSMSWPTNYEDDSLYNPLVSIKLGARYLSRQREYFSNDLVATLAAYNGGPGNTMAWKDLAGDDPDLLMETIRADESRAYIQQIYEFFNIYRLLYERGN